MSAPYYPRDGFGKYLGNENPLLDYLGFIRTLWTRIETLEALLNVVSDGLTTELGDLLLTEGGDSITLEA
jgi:hypothetical protein